MEKKAVIKTGGKQYLVEPGALLTIEKLDGSETMEEGGSISFDEVLMVLDGDEPKVGTPTVEGASVSATFLGNGRNKKVETLKYKSKSNYQKRYGHKQPHSKVRIEAIK
ncbi:MAG: 50S ribosomal protein L21 [Candidatus Vogelbacteria bacterium CG10_big_fil_rev_8_21_14_0_10_51_16]|uniref:Large ribosomal subunit protein bL21 n=1 Tax=Candidatus Vogelbacteria bacterium CG10_big_fil_rev_8_21_14_0_10_51_16 TaxID=1975045 RepID=A0A2H0REI5_9BACT|nr:MAG: 50S ribosomal protein L21 [Candidatus Vogelbacteria bacterium CG10_big_fil_rev_8_21_14_0_10_51_16]